VQDQYYGLNRLFQGNKTVGSYTLPLFRATASDKILNVAIREVPVDTQQFTITCPDDWHLHVRDGRVLATVVPHSARQFARALIMPNLKPPITTLAEAVAYRRRIVEAVPEAAPFQPLMTLYLNAGTSVAEVRRVSEHADILAFKLYPAGATTHSEAGVKRLEQIYPVLEAMERYDVTLSVHGEVTDAAVDIFDREKAFIDTHLVRVRDRFPALRIVLEHITTADAVQFIRDSGPRIAATITAHHLLYNRNALLAGGIRPHHYCLPVLKRERHRLALIEAATSGDNKFFLGTDSAPHPRSLKESACGCAGCYTAHAAMELYAEVFETAGALNQLEKFASLNGAHFYGLPRNSETVTLVKSGWQIPESYAFGLETVIPLRAGQSLAWTVARRSGFNEASGSI
jgi:dihydroorotase